MRSFALLILILVPFVGQAVARTSVQNGAWNNPNIWSPVGVPQPSDDSIIIATGVTFFGQNIQFDSTYFEVAQPGSLLAFPTDTFTFNGGMLVINGYTSVGVLRATEMFDTIVNYNQLDVNELISYWLLYNYNWICVASMLSTAGEVQNFGSISCQDWTNGARCGGYLGRFCIAQNFVNTDQLFDSIDVCDATPNGPGDSNTGWFQSSVTFCAVGPCPSCIQPGFDETQPGVAIMIVPNPVSFTCEIRFERPGVNSSTLSHFILRDVTGRVVSFFSFRGNALTFNRTGLESGLYFYQIENGNEIFAQGKLMLE